MIPEETALTIIHKSGSNKIQYEPFTVQCLLILKEMFYLTMHSTHFIYSGVRHFVKDHSARDKTHCHHFTFRTAHIMAFVTLVVERWLE